MRKSTFGLVFLVAACSRGPRLQRTATGTTELEIRGAVKQGPFSLGSADLEKLPRRTLRGIDPETGSEASWSGPSVAAMLTERIDVAKGADTAVARTADGAAIAIPLTVIKQLKPVLADRVDGVRTAMRILAWPTLEQRGLETDPRARGWWARGVVAFEIAEWQRTFAPALATPEGAPDGARLGANAFAERCISCHRLRGAGGQRGPDLTTVAARMRAAPFAELLERHPGARAMDGETDLEREATELWSFLRAVATVELGGRIEELTADSGAAGGVGRAPVASTDRVETSISTFVRERMGPIKACYEDALKRNPGLKGKISVRFTILETGGLTDVAAAANSTGSPEVAACIVEAMRAWRTEARFPLRTTVEYPFVFSPVEAKD